MTKPLKRVWCAKDSRISLGSMGYNTALVVRHFIVMRACLRGPDCFAGAWKGLAFLVANGDGWCGVAGGICLHTPSSAYPRYTADELPHANSVALCCCWLLGGSRVAALYEYSCLFVARSQISTSSSNERHSWPITSIMQVIMQALSLIHI